MRSGKSIRSGEGLWKGETIPHHEKAFSIFEEHTEWINKDKGKAGISQELGLKVCIVKDQFGFILHHRVMQKETDNQIAVPIIEETKSRVPALASCSFHKGFDSPSNQEKLAGMLDRVALPRKRKLSAINKEIENSAQFIAARHKHSAWIVDWIMDYMASNAMVVWRSWHAIFRSSAMSSNSGNLNACNALSESTERGQQPCCNHLKLLPYCH
jgi:hypothetical protein